MTSYDLTGCRVWSPTEEILNTVNLEKAVMECLLNRDYNGAHEMLSIYLEAVKRSEEG